MSRNFNQIGKFWIASKWSSPTLSRVRQPTLLFTNVSNSNATVWRTQHYIPSIRQFGCSSVKFDSKTPEGGAPTKGDPSTNIQDDRIKMFINPQVQTILKELTGRDLKRVFRKRKIGQKIKEPKYTFMTEAQLEEARNEAYVKAEKLLQMPPVLRPRKPIDKLLSFDPCIQSFERATLLFTDITMNVIDRDRVIVARDPDGTLRQATWQERDKANAIYFPVAGREFITPKMFSEPSVLLNVLNRASEEDNTYEFVLDRACVQFEPDDPLFISTVETTYDVIDQKGHYDYLKSTRHFGPMAFYLARTRKMDGILLHSVKHERISTDAVNLVTLFQMMFPECKSAKQKPKDGVDKVRRYIQLDAIKKGELELALNAFVEEEERKHELAEGLKRQHGIQ